MNRNALTGYDVSGNTATVSTNLRLLTPPSGISCFVSPEKGEAYSTLFTAQCTGSTSEKLIYVFYLQEPGKSSLCILLSSYSFWWFSLQVMLCLLCF